MWLLLESRSLQRITRFSAYPLIEEFDYVEMGDIRLALKNVIENLLGFFGYYQYLFQCETREKLQSSVLNLEITDC